MITLIVNIAFACTHTTGGAVAGRLTVSGITVVLMPPQAVTTGITVVLVPPRPHIAQLSFNREAKSRCPCGRF